MGSIQTQLMSDFARSDLTRSRMDESSSKPRRGSGPWVSRGAYLFWAVNAFALPVALAVNTPSSVWAWVGALFWEFLFVLALLDVWSKRRG